MATAVSFGLATPRGECLEGGDNEAAAFTFTIHDHEELAFPEALAVGADSMQNIEHAC